MNIINLFAFIIQSQFRSSFRHLLGKRECTFYCQSCTVKNDITIQLGVGDSSIFYFIVIILIWLFACSVSYFL